MAELVYSVFDEETVQQTIAERIDDGSCRISFGSSEICHTKVKHEYECLEKTNSAVFLAIDKKEIEQVREFDPKGWNHYPEITPPEQKRYLVFTEYEGPNRMKILYWVDLKGWEDEHVIAFRELPEPYKPETQK